VCSYVRCVIRLWLCILIFISVSWEHIQDLIVPIFLVASFAPVPVIESTVEMQMLIQKLTLTLTLTLWLLIEVISTVVMRTGAKASLCPFLLPSHSICYDCETALDLLSDGFEVHGLSTVSILFIGLQSIVQTHSLVRSVLSVCLQNSLGGWLVDRVCQWLFNSDRKCFLGIWQIVAP